MADCVSTLLGTGITSYDVAGFWVRFPWGGLSIGVQDGTPSTTNDDSSKGASLEIRSVTIRPGSLAASGVRIPPKCLE